jgi:molybdopterin molybdotransferase
MISVYRAQELLFEQNLILEQELIKLSDALKRIVAVDTIAKMDHPSFTQSAVDGYAFKYSDYQKTKLFKLIGESKAGSPFFGDLKDEECVRIFTGAKVPDSCDTIVMQEQIEKKGNSEIIVKNESLKINTNLRFKAEQVKKGEIALKKGTELNASSIALLVSIGWAEIAVFKKLQSSILVTGDEIKSIGDDLKEGEIYETNGLMIKQELEPLLDFKSIKKVKDNLEELKLEIQNRNETILFISGGVSVGDYDFTKQALIDLDYTIVFHNLAQKPGKPLLFAKKKDQFVFGLPGNPRSVFVSLIKYVVPFIYHLENRIKKARLLMAPLTHPYTRKEDGKVHFVSGRLDSNGVSLFSKQESHMLDSLTMADVLVTIDKSEYLKNDLVEVQLL